MLLFSRCLRRSVLCLLCVIPGICAAQATQFQNLPEVHATGGRVASFLTGVFQQPTGGTDILYIDAPVVRGTIASVTAGILLDGQGSPENRITFPNTTNVVAALGDYDGDGITDFAFAFIPQGTHDIDLCVYYGTGATAAKAAGGLSSFSPMTSASGCLIFPGSGSEPPVVSNVASFPLRQGGVAQLLLEDSANNILYIVANNGKTGSNGNLIGFTTQAAVLPDGAGPIYVGDFNGDGYTDFIVNGRTGRSASVYISSIGGSFFVPSHVCKFDHGVQSMLMQDMDGDGIADMVVEGTNGAIEIHKGIGDGTFATASEGGTGDDFAAMPAPTGPGAPLYSSTLFLTDIDGDGYCDLVVVYHNTSPNPEGAGPVVPSVVYIWYGNGDGTFAKTPQVLVLRRNYYLGAVADMNADGRPDIVLSDGSLISILYNQGGRSFGTLLPNGQLSGEQHFLAGQGINAISVADVNGDGLLDLIVANGGATISDAVVLGGRTASSISLPANPPDINTGGITVLLNSGDTENSRAARSPKHAITSATTTELFLCVGPNATCPAGYVVPPLTSTLSMTYGQYWNGTVLVTASDSGALPGNTVIYDSYNGGLPVPICTLLTARGGACDPSVGTTVGTGAGTNVITAAYVPGAADTTHSGSNSNAVTITVSPDTTTAALVGAPNPSPTGQPVTFTAALTGNFAAPAGRVNFVELFPPTNSVLLLGTVTLVPGLGLASTATFATSDLPLGTDSIEAQYAATLNFNAANSPVFVETITPSLAGSFTLIVTPTPVSVGVGYSTLLTVMVTPQNGFSQGVNLACANLPAEATCLFDTASLAGGGGTTNLVVATTAPHSCGTTQPYFLGANGGGPGVAPIALPALAGLLAMFLPGRRRWLRASIALIVVAGATQMTGCGNCTDLGTRPATYTFQVTGASAGTSEVQAQSVTMTVTI